MISRAWRRRLERGATAMALAIAALASPGALAAQTAAPSGVVAGPGETVRIRTATWLYTGILRRTSPDSAVIAFRVDSVTIARSSIVRVEAQRGMRRSLPRILVGTAIGTAAGAVIGGLAGVGLECGTSCADDGEMAGFAGVMGGGVLGGVAGGITGGVIGGRKRFPRWLPAVLPLQAP